MIKILLVEDDQTLGELLKSRLEKEGYQISWKTTVNEGLKESDFDLAILDIGLPDGNGFTVAENIKSKTKTPILFLTAQSDAESRLKGFEIGADEFIPKPFHLKELLMRIEHVLNQHAPIKEITLGQVTINFTKMFIKNPQGIEYPSQTDMKVLKLLIEKKTYQVSRDEIIDAIWGQDKMISHRTIDNIIVRLRHFLNDPDDKYIRSVRGLGYQWAYDLDFKNKEKYE